MMHKIDDWTIDENDNKKILIISHDATQTIQKIIDIDMNYDDEIILIHGEKYTVSEITKKYTTLSDIINHKNAVYGSELSSEKENKIGR